MNLAQNVCLDDFKVMYSFLSSDSLKSFHLGQFLSNYWSYRVIFGTCEVFVFRSVSQNFQRALLLDVYLFPESIFISLGNQKKSQGLRSGE